MAKFIILDGKLHLTMKIDTSVMNETCILIAPLSVFSILFNNFIISLQYRITKQENVGALYALFSSFLNNCVEMDN